MKQDTDQDLIAKTLQGQTKAFGALVLRYQDFIYTIVLRMVKTKEVAEEIAQDTFVKAYEKLSSFRGNSKFSSWLYSIAYRKALDHIKKQHRFDSYTDIEQLNSGTLNKVENALQTIIDNEQKEYIKQCIMQLPEINAALITLYYYDDLSVKEIAEITKLTEDTIKIRLYRSRKVLCSALEPLVQHKKSHHGKAI